MKSNNLILIIMFICAACTAMAEAGVDPAVVTGTLEPGDSMAVNKTVTMGALQAKADVVISVDLTGSMGGALRHLKLEIDNIITALAAESDDLNVGIVSHEDYPDHYNYCGYSTTYGSSGDEAFRVDHVVDDDFAAASAAINAMVLGAGADMAESYARVLWEAGHSDNLIGFRSDAQKIVVMFLDNQPHDCDLYEDSTTSTGVDPGRDELTGTPDDIDFHDDAIQALLDANITLLVINSGYSPYTTYWNYYAALTGGSAVQINSDGTVPGGISLTDLILGLVADVTTDIWWDVTSIDSGLSVSLSPLVYFNIPGDSTVNFTETIAVDDVPYNCCKDLYATVTFYSGGYGGVGTEIGTEDISIYVPDTTPPVITGVPPDVTVECTDVPSSASPAATDYCDADIDLVYNEVLTDGPCEDTYVLTRTWTATDDCSNVTVETQVITVQDSTPPVITGVPGDVTAECDSLPGPASPSAADNCDPDPVLNYTETQEAGDCIDSYTVYRTWTAVDRCSNSASQTQTIFVQDTTPPEVTAFFEPVLDDEDEEIEGLYVARFWGTDNCDVEVDVYGYLDVFGDETCEDEELDFPGYPVSDGDLVMLDCDDDINCWMNDEDTDEDEELDPVVHITGPGMRLHVIGEDNCENMAETEAIIICPDPHDCITALTLQNSMMEEMTFYWFEFTGADTVFEVGGEYGEFHTSCSQCLMVGDVSGSLTITCIQAGKKLAKKCGVPEDYFEAPCP